MAEEEEEVVGVKRRRAEEVEEKEVATMKGRAEEEEEVATVKKRKAEEVGESPLAKKGRLDEDTADVDNLPASLLSLSDDVILGVLRWANINNQHTHVVVIILILQIFGENALVRLVLTYTYLRHSQHQAQPQKLFVNQFCFPPKNDLEKMTEINVCDSILFSSRLSSWDLVQVSQTCTRLKAIAADR